MISCSTASDKRRGVIQEGSTLRIVSPLIPPPQMKRAGFRIRERIL